MLTVSFSKCIYLLFKGPHWLSGEVIFIRLCLFIVFFPPPLPRFPFAHTHSVSLFLYPSPDSILLPLNCITVMGSLTVEHKQTLR